VPAEVVPAPGSGKFALPFGALYCLSVADPAVAFDDTLTVKLTYSGQSAAGNGIVFDGSVAKGSGDDESSLKPLASLGDFGGTPTANQSIILKSDLDTTLGAGAALSVIVWYHILDTLGCAPDFVPIS